MYCVRHLYNGTCSSLVRDVLTCTDELQTPSQRWHASPLQWYVQFIGQDIWCMLCMQCTPTWRPLEYGWSGLLKGSWNVRQKMGVWMPHSDCFVQFRGSLLRIGPFGKWSRMPSYICWKVVVLESFQMALVGTPLLIMIVFVNAISFGWKPRGSNNIVLVSTVYSHCSAFVELSISVVRSFSCCLCKKLNFLHVLIGVWIWLTVVSVHSYFEVTWLSQLLLLRGRKAIHLIKIV